MALPTTSKLFHLSELKHTGKDIMVLCPFHDDHHPSLSINLEKNVYHCLGCGAKGRASELVDGLPSADKCQHIPFHRGEQSFLIQKWLAFEAYRQLGKTKEQEKVLACGEEFVTHHCPQCQKVTATPFHCNTPLCPACYRRNLASFFRKHRQQLQDMNHPCNITVSLGGYTREILEERAPEIWKEAIAFHKAIASYLPHGGIYIKSINKKDNLYWLELNLLVDAPPDAVLIYCASWISQGYKATTKSFSQAIHAIRFFIKEKCAYPSSMLREPRDAELYLAITYRKKLIQGFGSFYRVSGGKNKGKRPRQVHLCPFCGATTITGERVKQEQVFWDPEYHCFIVKQKLKEKRKWHNADGVNIE